MARTDIPVQEIGGPIPNSLSSIAFTAVDGVNDNSFINDGKTVLILLNGDTTAIRSAVVQSKADKFGRTGDQTFNVAQASAGPPVVPGVAIVGPFAGDAWTQSDGRVYVNHSGTVTNLKAAAVRIIAPTQG